MKKLIGLSKEEVKDISMQIADAFYDYKYNEEDLGLVKYIKSRGQRTALRDFRRILAFLEGWN